MKKIILIIFICLISACTQVEKTPADLVDDVKEALDERDLDALSLLISKDFSSTDIQTKSVLLDVLSNYFGSYPEFSYVIDVLDEGYIGDNNTILKLSVYFARTSVPSLLLRKSIPYSFDLVLIKEEGRWQILNVTYDANFRPQQVR